MKREMLLGHLKWFTFIGLGLLPINTEKEMRNLWRSRAAEKKKTRKTMVFQKKRADEGKDLQQKEIDGETTAEMGVGKTGANHKKMRRNGL